jgi:hypothetical protein
VIRNSEDGYDTFFETSVQTKATGYKVPEVSIIDTVVKASQKTVFFDHKQFPSMERLCNNDFTVTQLWNLITSMNHEGGDDAFSETSVRNRATRYKVPEGIYN